MRKSVQILKLRLVSDPVTLTPCCSDPLPLRLQISYWLIENGFSVLIAACDTFRAGAVEQLRTHQRRLNSLHPPEQHDGCTMVQLYEKGYGKDAAGIAMEAISYGKTFPLRGSFTCSERTGPRCLLEVLTC